MTEINAMDRLYWSLRRNSSSRLTRRLFNRINQPYSVLQCQNFVLKCPKVRDKRLFHSSYPFSCPQNPSEQSSTLSNTIKPSWVTNFPKGMQPYMRLARMDKPIGTWLLFLPCTWGTALATAAHTIPDPVLLLKFLTGAFIMRGAGCTINDLWDKDLDKQVARTQSRPLAAGEITPQHALAFLTLQLLSGLGILVTFNYSVIQVGLMSMPLVIAYPLMKRVTYWPQFVLGRFAS
ncbi:hypothetical protein EON63_14895 [archaeon]|nr:MAG: hypothetical protein EON63_14895 [archaeon]